MRACPQDQVETAEIRATLAKAVSNDALIGIREHILYGLRVGVRGDCSEPEYDAKWLESSVVQLAAQLREAEKENSVGGWAFLDTGYEEMPHGYVLDAAPELALPPNDKPESKAKADGERVRCTLDPNHRLEARTPLGTPNASFPRCLSPRGLPPHARRFARSTRRTTLRPSSPAPTPPPATSSSTTA